MPESTKMDPEGSKPKSGLTIKKEIPSLSAVNVTASKTLKISVGTNKIGNTSRLPSFKGPRDLTLSALASTSSIQPQMTRTKKTFVPNIPIRREKGDSKIIESKSEKSTKKSPNKTRYGDHNRGRGRGREFIQTRGALFGEGIAAAPLKRGINSYSGSDGKGGGSSKIGEMQKPVLNTEAAYNIDKDLEDKRLKEILRDDFIDDPDDVTVIDCLPVQLPMIACPDSSLKSELDSTKIKDKWKRRESFDGSDTVDRQQGATLQMGLRIKQEPDEEKVKMVDERVMNGMIRSDPARAQDSFEDSVASLLSKSQSDVMFLQLPSCLPGHPPEVKMEPNPNAASSSQGPVNKESNLRTGFQLQRNAMCTLDTLPEGRIGSLKVYESGKVELCLGNYNMELNRGTPVGFLQDIVRLDVDSEQKTGSMVVLGHVKERLVCTPDFQSLTNSLASS